MTDSNGIIRWLGEKKKRPEMPVCLGGIMERFEFAEVFSRKFDWAHKEIDLIDAKIHKTKGMFFTSHLYTVEELLASQHHKKIYSIVEKIADDVMLWHQNGKLSQNEYHSYNNHRDRLEHRLNKVNEDIVHREPTWWEEVRHAFVGFVRIVMHLLPKLVQHLLLPGKKLTTLLLPK